MIRIKNNKNRVNKSFQIQRENLQINETSSKNNFMKYSIIQGYFIMGKQKDPFNNLKVV